MATKSKKVPVKKTAEETPRPPVPAPGFGSIAGLRDEIDRVFERFFPESWLHMPRFGELDPFKHMPRLGGLALSPRADVSESETEYEIEVELPGLDEKEIELSISDGVLTLKGEKKIEREEKKKDYHLTERSYGSVRRSFSLPEGVDEAKIKASFAKGVLSITLPKSAEAKSKQRKIQIKAG